MSTGMPRPLSTTVTELSMWMVTSTSVGIPGERFVYGVVDDFVDQMMQTHLARRADVHRRPQANGFQTFEHLDTTGIVNFDWRIPLLCLT